MLVGRDGVLGVWLLAALVLAMGLQIGLTVVYARATGRLVARLGTALRHTLLERVQGVALSDPRMSRKTRLAALFDADAEAVEAAALIDLGRLSTGVFGILLGAAALFALDWRLTLVLALSAPLCNVPAWRLGGRAARAQVDERAVAGEPVGPHRGGLPGDRAVRDVGGRRHPPGAARRAR